MFWGHPSTAHPVVQAGASFLSSAGGTGAAAEAHGEDPPQGRRAGALPTPCSTGHFPSLKPPVLLARLTSPLGSPLHTAPADKQHLTQSPRCKAETRDNALGPATATPPSLCRAKTQDQDQSHLKDG